MGLQILRTYIRKLIIEAAKPKQYWGRGGAGMMFICREDNTVLLLHRADWVAQGGTWGVPGGSVTEDQWFTLPIEEPVSDDDPLFLSGARREVQEECGSLPPGFSTSNIFDETLFEDQGFKYKTFVYDIGLADKEKWELGSLDGETQEYRWVPIQELSQLPLHFGVEFTLRNTSL
jgi:8-oxo-dGTP diphosphatase